MKRYVVFVALFIVAVLVISGCGPKTGQTVKTNGQVYLTVTDDEGRKVVLPNKPERIVALAGSDLTLLDAVDVNLVGRVTTKVGNIPARYKDLPEVGVTTGLNIEKVVALKPDCVLAIAGQHDKYIQLLESNNIPVFMLRIKSFEDVKAKLHLMSQIAGTEAKGDAVIAKLDKEVNGILNKLPKEKQTVVILHATAKNVTVELDTSIAGGIAKMLQLENVADAGNKKISGDKVPYSLEELVNRNPSVIFLTSMGEGPDIEKRMKADVTSNPAWSSLSAVKNGKFYVLPEKYFLLSPGLNYPAAIRYMAKQVYPEAFTNEK
ncbi:Fe(3+)-citrate-binding protein YfmC [bioreactor metagenome]|uniref:Fe(3+)-citrate-binding protein YfmC n=1 Tax=bioreactor metagenome TaxID=1076179 RepID=A0A644TJP3_9ZZZZ|nr:ABC transporter substrate-binding protein [Acidaminococcaceae bacterium]